MIAATVLVCTRGRPQSVLRTVRSLLEHPGSFELLVMDQSDDAATEDLLASCAGDPRLRYHRTPVRGKGASLNQGLRLARASVVDTPGSMFITMTLPPSGRSFLIASNAALPPPSLSLAIDDTA